MRNRFVIVAALIAAMIIPTSSFIGDTARAQGNLTPADVEDALERRRAASASLEEMTARFEQAMADEEFLRERISNLAREVSRLEQEIGERRIAVRELVKERYMNGGGSLGTERVFTARSFTDIPVQSEYYAMEGLSELLRTVEAVKEKLHRMMLAPNLLKIQT